MRIEYYTNHWCRRHFEFGCCSLSNDAECLKGMVGSSVEERLWEKRYGGGGTQSEDETGTGGGSMKYVGVDSDSDSGCRSCVTCSQEDV
jgi:hypothetical protein